ncbi:MAG: EAL domain-containing protein [Acidimicrobiia bacterium]
MSVIDRGRRRRHDVESAEGAKPQQPGPHREHDVLLKTALDQVADPVTGVARVSEMLVDRGRDSSAAVRNELIELVASLAREAEGAMTDLLTLSRLDAGELEVADETVNLRKAVEEAVNEWERSQRARLTVTGDIDVRADTRLVTHIVSNLLRSAVAVGAENIQIKIGDGFNRVVLEVIHDGNKLTDGDPDQVFDWDYTSQRAGSDRSSPGLGLVVARRLARAMGGDLRYFRYDDKNVFEVSLRRLAKVTGRRGRLPDVVIDPSDGRPTPDSINELLADGGPTVVYQPIVDMRSYGEGNTPLGYESLSRFPHSSPEEWFDTAGSAGLGLELELAAIRAGIKGFVLDGHNAFLALNLSDATLVSSRLRPALDGADLGRLVLELSERARIKSYQETRRAVDALRDHGVRLALDDVGAEEIDLWHVLRLDPEIIKIDRRLVADTTQIRRNNALIRGIAAMADDLGIVVVAEGIETTQERDRLLELGVRFGQGYLFGRPRPLEWKTRVLADD